MELIIGFVLAVLGIVAAALSRQLADEFKAWTPWIVERLIKCAVHKLHHEQRERFEEEWLSHISEIPGEVGKLIAALGLVRASLRMSGDATVIKRALDIVVSSIMLFGNNPLFLVVALLIKLEDGGPILVRHEEKGLNGRTISVLKFRTMAVGCPPQRTRVGGWLLRFHYDEAPRMINVLRGDDTLPKLKYFIRALRWRDRD
jgi:hypothetical protein